MSYTSPLPPDELPRRTVRVYPLAEIFGWIAGATLFFWFFDAVTMVLLGLLAAACMAATLRPLIRFVPGPRWLAALVVGIVPTLVVGGAIYLLTTLLAEPIEQQLTLWPTMEHNLNELLARWTARLRIGPPPTLRTALAQVGQFLVGPGGRQVFSTTAGVIGNLFISLAFVFIGTIYLLAEEPGRLTEPLLEMLPPRRRLQMRAMLDELEPRLRGWLVGSLVGMASIGIASWIGYTLLGLELAIPLALLAGFLEIVPTIGPASALIVAALFAATQGVGKVAGVGIVYIAIQMLESHILVPLVMKRAVNISPVVTLFTIVLWGKIFGVAGLLLAIPLNLVIWELAEHFLRRPRQTPPGKARETAEPVHRADSER